MVGMTGDGVNDAPGAAPGRRGYRHGYQRHRKSPKRRPTWVLTDDNFATIASSVKEGRRVYDNLKKTILFIMPTNPAQGC